jgi:hypothetical protein
MNLGELTGLLLLIASAGVGLAALAVLCVALAPRLIGRAQRNIEQMPRRSFAVGLLNALFFGLLAAALSSGDQGAGLLALLILTILLVLVGAGLSAVAALVGERLGLAAPPPLRALVGMIVLALAALTPVAGWVGVAGLASLTGYGAVIIALFQGRQAQPTGDRS